MKRFVLLPIILSVLSCEEAPEPDNSPNLRPLSQSEIRVSAAVNDFGFQLLQSVQERELENTFLSPLSVSMALSMLLNGAEGEVEQSILNTLGAGGLSTADLNESYKALAELLLSMDRKVETSLANSVWHDTGHPVHETFASVIRNYYDGEVTGADFTLASTKDRINGWVEDKTRGRIKDLLEAISPDEILFIINAIYFKGEWTHQFDPARTHLAPFVNLDGTTRDVNMMFSKGAAIRHFYGNGLTVLDIPYGNRQFNFTVVMPDDPGTFSSVTAGLSSERLNDWLTQSDSISVELELPRFKMEWKADLKSTLSGMGMMMEGFPAMFEQPTGVQVSRVIHQTFLEVDEKGSEAAAATAIGMEMTSVGTPHPLKITIDKPFLFLIREKHTGIALFAGQFVDASVAR